MVGGPEGQGGRSLVQGAGRGHRRGARQDPGRDGLAEEWMSWTSFSPPSTTPFTVRERPRLLQEDAGWRERRQALLPGRMEGRRDAALRSGDVQAEGAREGTSPPSRESCASPDGKLRRDRILGGGAEYSEIQVLDVAKRELLPESIYPSYGPIGWTKDSTRCSTNGQGPRHQEPRDRAQPKTKLHKLGTPVTDDIDFFWNEDNPELGIAPREFPTAIIDESYPDYVDRPLRTVQQEMRLFYAPVLPDE